MILRMTIILMLFTIGCGDEGEQFKEGTVIPLSINATPPRLQNWGTLPADWRATPLATKVIESSFYVFSQINSTQYKKGGTAFLYDDNRLATAYHVVKGMRNVWFYELDSHDTYYEGTLLAKSTVDDLAIFSISGFEGEPLDLADSDSVHIGDPIAVVSNPGSLRGTFSTGVISGVRDITGLGEFQLDAPVSPGSSGAPVVNARGEVIAIVNGHYQITHGQNLNFAIPSNKLKLLLETID